MPRFALFVFTLFLLACESPHDKISRLQSETLAALVVGDSFEIKIKSRTFKLALPPEPEMETQRAQQFSVIFQKANSIDFESLSAADQQRLKDLNAILATLVQDGRGSTFDPRQCVVAELLQENFNKNSTKIILEKIPQYYAEVERRWLPPNKARAQNAAQQSLRSLEILDKMGDEAYPARLAVKDFIGMCQSAVCIE